VGDIFERNQRLGRGVNLGNALEAPKEGDWGITLEEADFKLIHEAGFNSVRVPIRWSAHAVQEAPYTIDADFFSRIDWVIQQAFANELAVVINMHHYDELYAAPDKHTERLLGMWQQIAQHYQQQPADLYFEPLNEPNNMSADVWNDLLSKAVATIRATNPMRPIIIGPVDWNSLQRLNVLKLPADDNNLIVTFHYYQPFQFTHQGAEWAQGSDAWMGTKWEGTTSERDSVDHDLDIAATWGQDNQRPIFMGEFGAYSKADMDSRVRWTAYLARRAEARQMSWAYWEFRSGFGVYDGTTRQWHTELKNVLVPVS
jgi:endoglucanase